MLEELEFLRAYKVQIPPPSQYHNQGTSGVSSAGSGTSHGDSSNKPSTSHNTTPSTDTTPHFPPTNSVGTTPTDYAPRREWIEDLTEYETKNLWGKNKSHVISITRK
ncbi:hypothetical protein BBBOND_0107640 [Babesia bigemina]|uniref:Uncharacterized protein n=1 Tax=Babesia bigemina TaxID=5866 RepID=A0A061D0X9_BABBI|nr:hypothetical protein BBBOND_0107640 [Babesia bigemina]CDR94466.1 hypothetical protein BBBOND_0107640 [Babesia bigemina]|eukprot:XP_012766652.1 hypothetical protein BBBOND_0107640 [Babesia bigemina]